MKTKTIVIISVLAALAVGYNIGKLQTMRSWDRYAYQCRYQTDASDAQVYTGLLTSLRNGDEKNCINTLEVYLDSSLIGLSYDYDELAKQSDNPILHDFRMTQDYRAKYPSSDTNLFTASRIKEVLALGR